MFQLRQMQRTNWNQPRPQDHLRFQDGGWVRRRPWRRAGHMTTKLANREPATILKQSKSPIFFKTRDLLFARVFLAPTRHLESGDGPGDEVELKQQRSLNNPVLAKSCLEQPGPGMLGISNEQLRRTITTMVTLIIILSQLTRQLLVLCTYLVRVLYMNTEAKFLKWTNNNEHTCGNKKKTVNFNAW